jgi:hypothetical protein
MWQKEIMLSFLFMILLLTACGEEVVINRTLAFDAQLWQTKEKGQFPHRPAMLDSILYTDTIASLDETELIQQLGPPDRRNGGYLYYLCSEEKVGLLTLHQSTLVIKLDSLSGVEWIKLHQ